MIAVRTEIERLSDEIKAYAGGAGIVNRLTDEPARIATNEKAARETAEAKLHEFETAIEQEREHFAASEPEG